MDLPAENEALQAHYRKRLASLDHEQSLVISRRTRHRIFLLFCLAFVLILGLRTSGLASWFALIPLIAGLASVPAYLGLQSELVRIQRLQVFHDTNLARVDGTRTQSGHTGEEFYSPSHLYDRDLNVLGPNSLFGLLATVRTGIGQRGLARILLDPAEPEQVLERQQSVQELAPLTTLREKITLLGPSRFQDVSATIFDSWVEEPAPYFHPAISWVLIAISVTVIGLLLAGLFQRIAWTTVFIGLACAFAVQGIVYLIVRARVLPILRASRVANQMQLFADGVALLDRQDFHSPRLQKLQQAFREPSRALSALRGIQNQFDIVEQLTREYSAILSILFSIGTQAAISISNWKRTHAGSLKQWIVAWAEFEALNALANYAFEHPQDVYPTLLSRKQSGQIHATALGHPLIPRQHCICNDIALDAETRFYLISGSNMAGKSTLLRAIGLNTVLAFAGAPVRATSLSLTPLRIGSSLALTDSLAESKSKFLAEVQRLHAILALSKRSPTLFLIDELFSGTNSHDRAIAAQAVLRDLLRNNAIGALSTHDLALTTLATPENHGINVHMASPNSDDPLAFDFLLKPGINPASNALAIIRMMDIET
ncbi:MAG: hypothetical protein JSS95_00340 [Acidobacteria bacterium]|nr:hypothetical protein [Acidobacteriota bacterium]